MGLVELGLVVRLTVSGVNPGDGVHVAPTFANLDCLVHCFNIINEDGAFVKPHPTIFYMCLSHSGPHPRSMLSGVVSVRPQRQHLPECWIV